MNAFTTTELDHYGRMADQWWSAHQPDHFRQLRNPNRFCQRISEAVSDQIDHLQADLQSRLQPNLEFMERYWAIRQTQLQAEELVLAEWFPAEGGPGRLPE